MVYTDDGRIASGFVRGWAHAARGWRLLRSHRVLLLVALALGAINVLAPRVSHRLVRPLNQQPAAPVERESQSERDLQHRLQLVGLYDVLHVIPEMPGANPGLADAVSDTERVDTSWWGPAMIATSLFEWSVATFVAGLLVCLLAGLVAWGVLDWWAAAWGGVRVFWRYLALAGVPAFLSAAVSLLGPPRDPALPALAVLGILLVIEVLRLTLILAWFIIAVDDMSLVRAVLVSGSAVWRRFSETAVVVLGIGLVEFLWVRPLGRLATYAWDLVYGTTAPPMAAIAVDVVIWSILAAIQIWFCLSALAWWTAIRDDSTPASPRQKGCQTRHA